MKWFKTVSESNKYKNDRILESSDLGKHSPIVFNKKLILKGIGFKTWYSKIHNRIGFDVGLTHYVSVQIPKNIRTKVKKTKIILVSNKEYLHSLGSFSKEIRSIKKPNPYKGKGIEFEGKSVKLKIGKVKT